jgi:hypothetical protein
MHVVLVFVLWAEGDPAHGDDLDVAEERGRGLVGQRGGIW